MRKKKSKGQKSLERICCKWASRELKKKNEGGKGKQEKKSAWVFNRERKNKEEMTKGKGGDQKLEGKTKETKLLEQQKGIKLHFRNLKKKS